MSNYLLKRGRRCQRFNQKPQGKEQPQHHDSVKTQEQRYQYKSKQKNNDNYMI